MLWLVALLSALPCPILLEILQPNFVVLLLGYSLLFGPVAFIIIFAI
jgi:hypothetical protein